MNVRRKSCASGAAVALTVLDVIERDKLVERAARPGGQLTDRLPRLRHRFDVVGDGRGRGLLQGMEFVKAAADALGATLGDTRSIELRLTALAQADHTEAGAHFGE
ncbi:aminotransferase class III-fold pyridoxal phosphate-dependent enzyme [Nonomuraea terrae]|uniref:aminotransferase class III-fold pyridoxal phosphate-dependent enzyme n=1 Tax=Nonomuraea terrae TaxID=2530383 RepID=UPI0037B7EE9B